MIAIYTSHDSKGLSGAVSNTELLPSRMIDKCFTTFICESGAIILKFATGMNVVSKFIYLFLLFNICNNKKFNYKKIQTQKQQQKRKHT